MTALPPLPDLSVGAVRLRAYGPSDLDEIVARCQDREIQRWTTVPVHPGVIN